MSAAQEQRLVEMPFLAYATARMTSQEFHESLIEDAPPQALSPALAGLWWDRKGDWTRAHESAQSDIGPDGAWVHAYLHRKEGDVSNAAYWYRRAGRPATRKTLEEEWNEILTSLIQS